MAYISKINMGGMDYDIRDKVLEQEVANIKPIVNQGTINNAADEEDLTSENGLLKLKNRSTLDGMGYVILRKDKVFAEQVIQENTIYEIRYDFDLGGGVVQIPVNCVLRFNGGSVRDGVICGLNTAISDVEYKIFGNNLTIQGTWNCEARAEWFDGDIQKALDCFNVVYLHANKKYIINDTLVMPARGKIVGQGNSSIIETKGNFTVVKMGYYSTLSNLAIRLNVLADVIEVSSLNIAETMKDIGEASPGNCNILIENVTINSVYSYEENEAVAIKLLSNGIGNLSGFWGVRVIDTNIFGAFRYGITVDCAKDNEQQEIEPWITDCHFLKINASQVMDFIKIGVCGMINQRYRPQRIEFTQCSMQSRDVTSSVFEHQKFAIVEAGLEINFNDCMPWDFDNINPMFKIFYGSKVNLSGSFTNHIDAIVELAGESDGKLPYSCNSTLYPSNDVREFYFNPQLPEDGHTASYKEAFGVLPDGDYYTTRTTALFRYIGIDLTKCKVETSSSFLPLLTKKKVLNGNTYLVTLRTNFGTYGSASCVYCRDNENDEIEWRYDAKDIPVFSTKEDISSDYIKNNNNSFVIINGQIAYISGNRLTDLRGSEFIPAFYNKTIAELPQLNNHKFNDGKCVFVNGSVKPVYYSYRDKIWVDAMGSDASLYSIGSVAPTSKKVFEGFKFYSYKYKKILICVSSKRTVGSDGSITYNNQWVDANGYTPSISVGTTQERPLLSSTDVGYQFFDTTINKPIWWTGTKWIDANGADV